MPCFADFDTLVTHFKRLAPIVRFTAEAAHAPARYGPHGFGDSLKSALNPCYGQMSDLGVVLGAYYSGPHSLATPLGYLRIGSSCSGDEASGWYDKVHERLGLKPIYGEMRNGVWGAHYAPDVGELGPGYAVLRDMDGRPFDEPKTPILGWFTCPMTERLVEYDEAKGLWDRVRKEVWGE
jgi:hypothetical protein